MFLKIKDNLFNEKIIDDLYFYFLNEKPWTFTGIANQEENQWRKFSADIDKKHLLEKVLFEKSDEIFKSELPQKFNNYYIGQSYASGYLYGTHHEIHTDCQKKDDGYTVMFYLNKAWDVTFAGETIFIDENRDVQKSIIPKPGRALFFDGSIPHCAREVSRICIDFRIVVTFKYYGKWLNERK
tara:strand:- start:846 stop:1394 length:549 start_codon:yes stop_codon:yes gene_type:complete